MSTYIKKVALTFDDGPNPPYTDKILDILKREDIKATFFVCGANIKRHPDLVKKIASEGHQIGNHTYNHSFLPTLLGLVLKETLKTQTLIEELTAQKLKLFRSPFLIAPFWLKNKLKKMGYAILGGIVGNDWQEKITADQIAQKILSQTSDKSIIILHDGNGTKNADRSKTVAALIKIIAALKAQKIEFVQINEI